MQVILLKDVINLGQACDIVDVKPGYARNFLFTKSHAIPANKANKAKLESMRQSLQAQAAEVQKQAQDRMDSFKNVSLSITVQVANGKMFGSVGTPDVIKAFEALNLTVTRSEVHLSQSPIRQPGDYDVILQFHPRVKKTISLTIIPNETQDQDRFEMGSDEQFMEDNLPDAG